MSALPVVKMGTPSLQQRSQEVTAFATPELYTLIEQMTATMHERNGVGIAAPQIGVNQRVIIFGFDHSPRYPNEKPVPFTVLVNPVIKPLSNEMVEAWEGCLSIPGLRGLVSRYQKIQYSGYTPEGQEIVVIAEGFHARMLQHECDHLDGKLFVQRMRDMQYFGFEDVLPKR